jgi:hypothetical protein
MPADDEGSGEIGGVCKFHTYCIMGKREVAADGKPSFHV